MGTLGIEPGAAREKRECYLCAMQPPLFGYKLAVQECSKKMSTILSKLNGSNLGLNLAIKLFEKPELYFINSQICGTKSSQQEQERGLT